MSSRRARASMADVSESRPAPPCTFVIFGAMGDLTPRLLLPAMYNLAAEKLLPEKLAVLGIARSDRDDESLRHDLREALKQFAPTAPVNEAWRWLSERIHYLRGEFQ